MQALLSFALSWLLTLCSSLIMSCMANRLSSPKSRVGFYYSSIVWEDNTFFLRGEGERVKIGNFVLRFKPCKGIVSFISFDHNKNDKVYVVQTTYVTHYR